VIADFVVTEWAPADTPFDTTPTWVEISSKVRTIRAFSGCRSPRDLAGPGSLTLEVNNDLGSGGWLDPDVWYRYRQIRVTTEDSVLFRGWIKSVTYDVGFRDGISQARIEAIDAIGLLAEGSTDADFATYAAGTPLGAVESQTIGNRAGYVTDAGVEDVFAWVMAGTQIVSATSGTAGLIPMFVEAKQAGNALQLLQNYLEADVARLATDDNAVELHGRYKDFELAADAAAPDATLADDGTGSGWLIRSLVLAAPDETYVDDCTYGGQGIDNQRTADTPTGYPPSTYVRTSESPIADENWAKANADYLVEVGKQTDTFPRQLTCYVAGPTATSYDSSHPAIVGAVDVTPFDVKYAGTTYKVVPLSMEHQIDQTGWRCTFGFRSLDRILSAYGGGGVFKLGSSALGGSEILGP
jgi:hypothetical protein